MANSIIKGFGGEIVGTNYNPAIPNQGTEEEVSIIRLPIGKWLFIASGYCPLDTSQTGNNVERQASSITIAKKVGTTHPTIIAQQSLSYLFNVVGVYDNTVENQLIALVVTNWETTATMTAGTSYTFKAIKIA